jgi:hypothetical protein
MADIRHEYTQEDFSTMVLRVAAVRDFAKLIDGNYDEKEVDGPVLASIALILETMLEPIEDFLSWASTYASIPDDDKPETTTSE